MLSTTGDRIKKRRLELGLTADRIGEELGVSRSTIFRYENGYIEKVPVALLEPLARILRTTPEYLIGVADSPQDFSEWFSPLETRKFRMLGNIACGEPIFAAEEKELYIEAGAGIRADFCLKAKGDSMIGARIQDGDIVFIRQQSTVDDGEIAAVLIGDDVTLKRVYYDREANSLFLRPENPQYKTMRYSGAELNEIKILGKAVAFQSDVK